MYVTTMHCVCANVPILFNKNQKVLYINETDPPTVFPAKPSLKAPSVLDCALLIPDQR